MRHDRASTTRCILSKLEDLSLKPRLIMFVTKRVHSDYRHHPSLPSIQSISWHMSSLVSSCKVLLAACAEAVGVQWWESLFRCASVSDAEKASARYGCWRADEAEEEGASYLIVHYYLRRRGILIDIGHDCAKCAIGLRVALSIQGSKSKHDARPLHAQSFRYFLLLSGNVKDLTEQNS
jgi:hypothetical protein